MKQDEYIQQVATTMLNQLIATVDASVLLSWGIVKPTYTLCNGGMPSLQMKVDGRLFKGYVLVALDEGSDTYKIFVKKTRLGELECICEEAYWDNFGEIIDRYIESGNDMEEYKKWMEEKYGCSNT